MGTSYRLIGGSHNSELEKYVNSDVEIKGTMIGRDASMGGGAGTTGSPTATNPAETPNATGTASDTRSSSVDREGGNTPALRVTSVRQISSTCSSGTER